jgi:protein-L-isoaspartate(D-aspartate) O-methyltransferase
MLRKKYLKIIYIPACFLILLQTVLIQSASADYKKEREQLVNSHIINAGIKDPYVIDSMLRVPREEFVPDELRKKAYLNQPLPIGYGQTISQPYVVALMTELLNVDKKDKVLEIGTGSGYQAAVLANIAENVYTVEIIEPLGRKAKKTFKRLGYSNISAKVDDGYFGWEEHAPFDAIMVTAAADHIPPPLIKQLKRGGRMCIPVGQPYFTQILKLLIKDEKGKIFIYDILPVVFVPLTREIQY